MQASCTCRVYLASVCFLQICLGLRFTTSRRCRKKFSRSSTCLTQCSQQHVACRRESVRQEGPQRLNVTFWSALDPKRNEIEKNMYIYICACVTHYNIDTFKNITNSIICTYVDPGFVAYAEWSWRFQSEWTHGWSRWKSHCICFNNLELKMLDSIHVQMDHMWQVWV